MLVGPSFRCFNWRRGCCGVVVRLLVSPGGAPFVISKWGAGICFSRFQRRALFQDFRGRRFSRGLGVARFLGFSEEGASSRGVTGGGGAPRAIWEWGGGLGLNSWVRFSEGALAGIWEYGASREIAEWGGCLLGLIKFRRSALLPGFQRTVLL